MIPGQGVVRGAEFRTESKLEGEEEPSLELRYSLCFFTLSLNAYLKEDDSGNIQGDSALNF